MPHMAGSIPSPQARPGARVLIVDPDADTRLLYRVALEHLDVVITEAEDGAEALREAIRDPPAVLVMETRLPQLNGLALCASLRRNPSTAGTHIIVATATVSSDAEILAVSAGANQVLLKPYAIEQLITRVRIGLSAREGQRHEAVDPRRRRPRATSLTPQ